MSSPLTADPLPVDNQFFESGKTSSGQIVLGGTANMSSKAAETEPAGTVIVRKSQASSVGNNAAIADSNSDEAVTND